MKATDINGIQLQQAANITSKYLLAPKAGDGFLLLFHAPSNSQTLLLFTQFHHSH